MMFTHVTFGVKGHPTIPPPDPLTRSLYSPHSLGLPSLPSVCLLPYATASRVPETGEFGLGLKECHVGPWRGDAQGVSKPALPSAENEG
ncbi:hypothetical protein E2C01_084029 [Portunus trituberculatus]|uniref:Uncharacterized protein n=1 Tax=Portunus trituberculatus TaxID=210409 RepID=A0A5B7J6D3_PORTR|nr:hypothetical protein [Portunus trituberculatus]